jgi:60 kDa SS-A/Ro ribonucleoprotein
VVDALDAAFYTAFENVEPAGQRFLIALDVSGSMTWGDVAVVPGLTPRDASAALALVTAATEPNYEVVGFFAGRSGVSKRGRQVRFGYTDGLTPLSISPRQRLDDVVKTVSDLPFGGTDCALPMLYAQAKQREIDTFVIYTDSETWAGGVHPAQALREYRSASGIAARLVVVGMVSNGFSIADPADQGMLDVVGFDTATPQLISDFARGADDFERREDAMRELGRLYTFRVPAPPVSDRSAKVIALRSRRQARLERLQAQRDQGGTPFRPAA